MNLPPFVLCGCSWLTSAATAASEGIFGLRCSVRKPFRDTKPLSKEPVSPRKSPFGYCQPSHCLLNSADVIATDLPSWWVGFELRQLG